MGNKPDPLPELVPAPESVPAKKPFFAKGALKGLAIAAAIVVGVSAIVFGAVATSEIGPLTIDGNLATTILEGMGHGVKIASEVLFTNWMGGAALAVGAALGVAYEYKVQNQEAAVAPDTEAHTKIRELTEALEVEKTVNQQLTTTIQEKELAPAKEDKKKDGIFLAGSVIENPKFRAGELKRRAEVTASAERTV